MNFRNYDIIQDEGRFKASLENTFLKTSASRVKIPELFDMTHYSMKCFSQMDSLGKVEWTEVAEDEIFEKLREYFTYLQLDDIEFLERRIYFIQGDTGTGKSELCMYLKNKLEQEFPEDLILIPIWKNQSWTQICGETLPNKFTDILKDERFSDILNNEKYRHLFHDHLKEQQYFSKFLDELRDPGKKERIAGSFAIGILNQLRDKGYVEDAVVSRSRYGDFEVANPIRAHLVKNMDNLLHSTEGSPHDDSEQFYVFESNDVDDLKLKITLRHRLDQEFIANEMENALHKQIKTNYNIKDMNEILESFNTALEIIQKETGNKNLRFLLIFEDFALRGSDLEDFVNFISSDSLNNFNYIIAGTFDKIDRIEEHTLEARSEYFFTTKRGEMEKQTPFLSDKTVADFVYNYMNYFKKKLGLDIEILNEVEIFFPLSRVFVTKLYQNVKGDNLKPRDFLKIIHLLIYEFCNAHAFPFISAKELPYDDDLPLGIGDSYLNNLEIFEDDALFISWYGVKITGTVQIEEYLHEQFGFESNNVELVKESIDPFEIFAPPDEEGNDEVKEEVPQPPAPPTPQEEFNNILDELFNEVKPYIKTWVNNPKTELENDLEYYFFNGIKEILEELTDDFKIYNVFHFYKGQTDFLEARLDYISDINEKFTIQVSDSKLKLNLMSINLKSFIYRVLKLGILHYKSSKFRNYSSLRHDKIKGLIEELTENHIHNLLNLKSSFEVLVFKKITDDFFLYTINKKNVDKVDDNIDTFLFFFYTLKYIMLFLQSPLSDLADLSFIKKSLYNPNIGSSSLIQLSSIQTGHKLNNFINNADKIQEILINLILNSTDNITRKLIDIISKKKPDGTLTIKYVPESLINYFFEITRKTPGNKGILSDIKIKNVNFVGTKNSVLSSIKDFKQYINENSISEQEEIVKALTSQFNTNKLLLKEILGVDVESFLDYLKKHPNIEQHSAIEDEISYLVKQLSSAQYSSLIEIGDSLDENLKNLYSNILTKRFFLEDIVDSLNDNDLIKSYKKVREKLKDPLQNLDKKPIENILDVIKNDSN